MLHHETQVPETGACVFYMLRFGGESNLGQE